MWVVCRSLEGLEVVLEVLEVVLEVLEVVLEVLVSMSMSMSTVTLKGAINPMSVLKNRCLGVVFLPIFGP